MTPFEEMESTRQLGRVTFELFVRSVPSVARLHGFPPPAGAKSWNADSAKEWLINEFFPRKGHEVALKLWLEADDDVSFERLVRRAIVNALKDEAKATTVGKLRSRMRTLLAPQPDFVDATALYGGDHAWTLGSFGDAVYSGDWMDLLSTPHLKQIEPIRALNTAGPTSKENADKLVTAARILITAAGGAIRDQVLAAALVALFDLDAPDAYVLLEDDEGRSSVPKQESPEAEVEAIAAADALIYELTADECRVLPVLDEPLAIAEAYAPHIPNMSAFRDALKIKLRTLIDRDELPPGALNLVLGWCSRLPDP